MTYLQILNAVIVTLGIPAIIGTLIKIGRKLEVLDYIKRRVEDTMEPDIRELRDRVAVIEGKMAGVSRAQSPISLTDKGQRFLTDSGMKEFVDSNYELLVGVCLESGPLDSPYDVQQASYNLFDRYQFPKEVDIKLKDYAYSKGISMALLRQVGAIYFRDKCIEALGMNASELDREK